VYGFHVSNFQISPATQSLLLSDHGYDVFMEFNYGSFQTGWNWGMAGEETALWPTQYTSVAFTLASGTSVSGNPASVAFEVAPCRPNPTAGATLFDFSIPRAGSVKLDIFDIAGRLIRTIARASLAAGRHEVSWDGRSASGRELSPGIYEARFSYEGRQSSQRIAVIR